MPNTLDFERELKNQLAFASKQGKPFLDVNAGELHRAVGGYPQLKQGSHAMPTCCNVMRAAQKLGKDVVLQSPPKGRGASLTIRYRLPRV